MGRKKIDKYGLIEEKRKLQISYCKRKRGLIKKAMELTMLCDQKISLIIFDENRKKLVSYNSPDFDHSIAQKKYLEFMNLEKSENYELKDYEKFKNN